MTNLTELDEIDSIQSEIHQVQDLLVALRSKRDAEIVRLVTQAGFSRYRLARVLEMSESAIKKIVDRPGLAFDELHSIQVSPKSAAYLDEIARSGRRIGRLPSAEITWETTARTTDSDS